MGNNLSGKRTLRIALLVLAADSLERLRIRVAGEFGLWDLPARFGVPRLKGSGWEIHHLQKGGTHYLKGDLRRPDGTKTTYSELSEALGEGTSSPLYGELEREAANCAIVPGWFHRLLHSRLYAGLSTRAEVYAALKELLGKAELFQRVHALKFRGSTVAEALSSLERLLSLAWMVDDEALRNNLRKYFDDLKARIKKALPAALADIPLS